MDYNYQDNNQDPWEQNFYETGSTRPPKSRRGFLAVILIVVIFIGGIVSALSLMNLHLFQPLNDNPEDTSFRFSDETSNTTLSDNAEEESQPTATSADMQLQLNNAPPAVENIPQAGGLSLQSIYEKAIVSVVSVSCKTANGGSTGSGVILSANGYIVTNCHVIDGATAIEILLYDGTTLSAKIVGADTISDLAVLHVDAANLTPAEFGDSSSVRVGDSVVAIGDPLGVELRGSMTDGIISAINRNISTQGRTLTLLQTNAALNAGNSGGPLLNCYGQVIGINTMKIGDYMSSAGVEGLGFAIPSITVKEIVDQLLINGYVSGRPSLGITGENISSFEHLYYHIPQGVYVAAVEENSNAAAQGIRPGDILLQFDGQRVTDLDTLQRLLFAHNAGDTVSVVLYRNGSQYSVQLTLDEAQ